MKCPLKFSRYEFEGGTDCIGAECGFFGSVCDATNGIGGETNGIADDSPLVESCTSEDEKVQGLPDDNVLYLLRDVAKKSDGHTLYHGVTKLMQAIGKEPEDRRETGNELAIALNTLADMIERDYVSRQDFAAQHRTLCAVREQRDRESEANRSHVRVIAKLEAERDEWKAKAEHDDAHSKAQSTNTPTLSDLYGILSDANDNFTPESVVTPEAVDANDANVTQDTRDKLEEVAWQYDASYAEPYEHGAIAEAIIELLDRQAAITRAEIYEDGEYDCATCDYKRANERQARKIENVCTLNAELQAKVDELYKSCDILRDKKLDAEREKSELQERVDELTEQLEAAHAKNRALKAHISKMQAGRHGWHAKGVELEKENAELQAAYDELAAIAAQLCRACGFSMVDAAGEVIS